MVGRDRANEGACAMNTERWKSAGLCLLASVLMSFCLTNFATPARAGERPSTQGAHPINPGGDQRDVGQQDPFSVGFPSVNGDSGRFSDPSVWKPQTYFAFQPCGWFANSPYYSDPSSSFAYGTPGWTYPSLLNQMQGLAGSPELMSWYSYSGQLTSWWDASNETFNPTLGSCASPAMWWYGP